LSTQFEGNLASAAGPKMELDGKQETRSQACKKGEITVQRYKYTTADGRNAADLSLDKQVRYRTRTVHL